jgi:3-oxoacyl-[acyl-carrier-protein] synthase II
MAIAGGLSESTGSFGIFASFKSQGALADADDPRQACKPFDVNRNGIVVSEGGCIYILETLTRARTRNARIYGEIVGYAMNSDAKDPVLPFWERQVQCMQLALDRAAMTTTDIDLISTHATGTRQGDNEECRAIRSLFADSPQTYVNNTKSIIGHAMGAAGVLELAGNLGSFEDGLVHPTINVTELDPACALDNLVINEAVQSRGIGTILNNSFGMMGINSVLIVRKNIL